MPMSRYLTAMTIWYGAMSIGGGPTEKRFRGNLGILDGYWVGREYRELCLTVNRAVSAEVRLRRNLLISQQEAAWLKSDRGII
jgi:hypothetical protein